ncbi:MAG: Serine phosphatase RsbU, regulator of sigma subunit [Acidobacteria bacterium]|nr:Serine phosphatase RsbU, regulator of sigma subunit [Acidobacteriota bacterium]
MSPLADLLSDLQQLEKAAAAKHGTLILDAFTRHTPFRDGAVYLRDGRDPVLRLAARSGACTAPELVDNPSDLSLALVLPLRGAREHVGILGFDGAHSDDDLRLAHVAAGYLGMLMTNQRLTSEAREGDFQLKYRLWELESLYDIGLSIASTLNIDELADEVLNRMISLLNVRRAALFLRDDDRFALYRSFGEVPQLSDDDYRRLVATGEPIRHEEGTVVALPIAGNNAIIGVLAAAERETRDGGIGSFDANDLRLLSLFASQVAIALENARLHKEALEKQAMQREMELAATIQANILPHSIPDIEGFEIASLSIPARQVGGDYHAFFEHEGVASMLVADVAGKSMPAALLVSAFHAAIQLLMEEGRELGEIATELNKHIHRWSAENKFITMLMVSIDRNAEVMRYVNAGHNPGYVLADGQLDMLKSHGLPIGILGNSQYLTQTRPFPAGSTVVIYSDGITEAENLAGDEFDNIRLEPILREHVAATPAELRDRIAAAVTEFVGLAPQKDDQTLVIARSAP